LHQYASSFDMRLFVLGSSFLLGVIALALPSTASAETSQRKDPPLQWWLAVSGGYGRMDVYFRGFSDHPSEYQGTLSAASYGARLGLGGFSGRHLQLGWEASFLGVQAIEITRVSGGVGAGAGFYSYGSLLDGRQPKSFGFVALMPLGLAMTGYAFDRYGPFLSGAVHGGFGMRWRDHGVVAGAYSASVGYAFLNLLGRGRTSVAVGYESSGVTEVAFNDDDSVTLYDGHQFTLSLQTEL
jgi:hypothetical protein